MNEESRDTIDPQLEARLVALVLGEASDFERDELERMMAERPELNAFCDEVRELSGLLTDIGTGEMSPPDDEWKLAEGKRDAVLSVFNGDAKASSTVGLSDSHSALARNLRGSRNTFDRLVGAMWQRRFYVGLAGAAAVLLIVVSVSVFQVAAPYEYAVVFTESAPMVDSRAAASPARDANADSPFKYDRRIDEGVALRAKQGLGAVKESIDASSSFRSATAGVQVAELSDLERPAEPASERFQNSLGVNGVATVDGLQSSKLNKGLEASVPDAKSAHFRLLDSMEGEKGYFESKNESGPQRRAGGVLVQPNAEARFESPARFGLSESPQPQGTNQWFRKTPGNRPVDANEPFAEANDKVRGELELRENLNGDLAGASQNGQEANGEAGPMGGGMGGMSMGGGGYGGGGYGGAYGEGGDQSGVAGADVPNDAPADRGFAGDDFGVEQGQGWDQGRGGWRYRSYSNSDQSVKTDSMSDGEQGQQGGQGQRDVEQLAQQNGREKFSQGFSKRGLEELQVPRPNLGDVAAVEGQGRGKDFYDDVWMDDSIDRQVDGVNVARDFKSWGTENREPAGDVLRYSIPAGDPAAVDAADLAAFGNRHKETDEEFGDEQDSGVMLHEAEPTENLPPVKFFLDNNEQPSFESLGSTATSDRRYVRISPRRIAAGITSEGLQTKLYARPQIVPAGLDEKNAANEAFSTFSLHVGDVSFKLAQSALSNGQWPDASTIRIEEFVNAFDYGDPMPGGEEKVACCVEQAAHPFLQQRNVLRVAMRTAAAGRAADTPLRLTFLLDNSGSMERPDRQQTVRRAFESLAQQLKPTDQVTLNSFARQPRLIADQVNGSAANQLVETISNLPSEGGTNVEAALKLGFEKAIEQRMVGAQNRVVLLTDGAVNLGNANAESLSQMVSSMREAGIAFDAAGISADGLNDEVLEALTRKGDGRYYLLDSEESADDGFAQQIAGALRPSAKNVKIQVEFNSARVGNYKLLGFEKHRLNKEDFRNDQVDAAEMAAEEAGVAVYQFEAKPDGEGDVGSVSVRFRDLSSGQMVENRWPIPYQPDAPSADQASPSLKVATTAAMLAAKLKDDALGGTVELRKLSELVNGLPSRTRQSSRVQQLQQMIQQAREITGQ